MKALPYQWKSGQEGERVGDSSCQSGACSPQIRSEIPPNEFCEGVQAVGYISGTNTGADLNPSGSSVAYLVTSMVTRESSRANQYLMGSTDKPERGYPVGYK